MKIYIKSPIINGVDTAEIYILDEEGKDRYVININSDGFLTQTLLNPNEATKLKPFLELPSSFFDKLVKAMVDYASENNIKTENETLLQGKLVATEKHLEDLRKHFEKVLDKIVSN